MKLVLKIFFYIYFALIKNEVSSSSTGRVVCYYESWAVYRPGNGKFEVENIDPNLCTHIIYAFITTESNGVLIVMDPNLELDSGKAAFRRFTKLKLNNTALKAMVAVGSWSAGSTKFSKMVSNNTTRQIFVKNAVKFLKDFGFDGLDIDWEFPNQNGGQPPDVNNFVALIQELRIEFDKYKFLLSAAVGATRSDVQTSYSNIVPLLSKYLDFINLMTYDLHGFHEGVTGENAPVFASPKDSIGMNELNVDNCLTSWLEAVLSSSKLNLGIPTYGRTYTLVNTTNNGIGAPVSGPGKPGPYTNNPGFLGYNEIIENQKNGTNWTSVWNIDQMVPYMYKGNQWVGYDNRQSAVIKAMYSAAKNLGGITFWSMDTDDFRGLSGTKFPLISSAKFIFEQYFS